MERSADWMDQAQGDLVHAKSDLEREFYDWACFSAQQAAEKAVKAVFQKMGAEAWGHSVADLMYELSSLHAVPEALIDAALELDKAYIPTRYPHAHPSGSPRRRYTRAEAERMVGHAEQIVHFGESLLSTT
ncbi:MAG TPA: HEPN domain-containing protein [Chloroflexi bacterium]|nr:HEPN domain-containing protein [Chloroflexota bacterium]